MSYHKNPGKSYAQPRRTKKLSRKPMNPQKRRSRSSVRQRTLIAPKLSERFSRQESSKAARKVWKDTKVADKIALDTHEILKQIYPKDKDPYLPSFLDRCENRTVFGGLFYILGSRYQNTKKTMKEIAKALGTHPTEIMSYYHMFCYNYPEILQQYSEGQLEIREGTFLVTGWRDKTNRQRAFQAFGWTDLSLPHA